MKLKSFFLTGVFLAVSGAFSLAGFAGEEKGVSVEIDYGGNLPSRTYELPAEAHQSVLELLLQVAAVETQATERNVIVTAVDGVRAERGETAWYYQLNGEHADELAFSKIPQAGDRIRWEYKEDLCSATVDGKK